MKKILILLFVFVITGNAKAQYANTSWKGIYYLPDATEMVLQFKKDTLLFNYFADGSNAETMNYQMKGDTLIMTKISGISPCDGIKGSYKLSIKDDKLFMTLIDDSCDVRASAMPGKPLEKL
ncbi:MAG TPA: hypothetical protein VFU62_02630 [Hanamia sp.]|jgi:hypothetical protein|nr:hypothetical protein [Hanamia sp.]